MQLEYDPDKDAANCEKHGISLADAVRFEWGTAHIEEDERLDYGEPRFQAVGYIGLRLHFVVFCLRDEKIRVISLRKANPREVKRYAKT